MANVTKKTLNSKGNWINCPKSDITITLDGSITVADLNTYLANNGTQYDREMGIFISGSQATVLTPDTMYVCTFIAEAGALNSQTGYQEGIWRCLGKKTYLL